MNRRTPDRQAQIDAAAVLAMFLAATRPRAKEERDFTRGRPRKTTLSTGEAADEIELLFEDARLEVQEQGIAWIADRYGANAASDAEDGMYEWNRTHRAICAATIRDRMAELSADPIEFRRVALNTTARLDPELWRALMRDPAFAPMLD